MDKVIVTGLLIVGAVTAAVVVILTIGPSIGGTSQSVVESQGEAAARIKTSIEIIAVASNSAGTKVEAWVKNVGVSTVDSIDKSDVFLIKSGTRFDAMTYSGSGSNKTWTGDLGNNSSWDRGVSLHVTITLSGGDVLGSGNHILRVSTFNGITDEKTFSK